VERHARERLGQHWHGSRGRVTEEAEREVQRVVDARVLDYATACLDLQDRLVSLPMVDVSKAAQFSCGEQQVVGSINQGEQVCVVLLATSNGPLQGLLPIFNWLEHSERHEQTRRCHVIIEDLIVQFTEDLASVFPSNLWEAQLIHYVGLTCR
jgi:hypothetical protein